MCNYANLTNFFYLVAKARSKPIQKTDKRLSFMQKAPS